VAPLPLLVSSRCRLERNEEPGAGAQEAAASDFTSPWLPSASAGGLAGQRVGPSISGSVFRPRNPSLPYPGRASQERPRSARASRSASQSWSADARSLPARPFCMRPQQVESSVFPAALSRPRARKTSDHQRRDRGGGVPSRELQRLREHGGRLRELRSRLRGRQGGRASGPSAATFTTVGFHAYLFH